MNSIWTETAALPHFPSLEGSAKTDVLIIGGGIAGILCAYFLQERGVDYLLAEKERICSGITGNTTAKITSQHGLIYHKLIKSIGCERTKLYLQANEQAVRKYYELCQNIDCGFETKTSYVYSMDNRKKLEQEADSLQKIGFHFEFTDAGELPFSAAGAVGFANQAQFHPLSFLSHIAKNLNIYEHTFVKELSEHTAVTEQGSIQFQKIIFATHFPIDNKHGMYFFKMYQDRSYVIALENAARVDAMYVDEEKHGLSFRSWKEYLLLGGGGSRTGKKGGNWRELREFAQKYYPNSREICFWAAQDCMSLDHIPYIGQYSKRMAQCYVATGFNKWGISSSMTAAMLLADMITEKENIYQEVFNPSRNMLKPQLFLNGWESAVGLLTISKKRCPHLGCALKWNPAEHSWDCSCHGSRFDENGRLLDNPANGDIKERK